ncbi:MAG: hypothetical protein KA436_06925 [Oligoflexales bacterium]|nr:hypothetical protein [Oligoflexales bacterium]
MLCTRSMRGAAFSIALLMSAQSLCAQDKGMAPAKPNPGLVKDSAKNDKKTGSKISQAMEKGDDKEPDAPQAEATAAQAPAETAPAAPAAAESRSAFGELLHNRFRLTTALGFLQLKKGSDSWRANGFADIEASYLFPMELMGAKNVSAFLNYSPYEVAPKGSSNAMRQEYKGTLQTYSLGGAAEFAIRPTLDVFGRVALRYMQPKLRSLLSMDAVQAADSKSAVILVVGVGMNWQFREAVLIGPRVQMGLGTFRSQEYAGQVSFLF